MYHPARRVVRFAKGARAPRSTATGSAGPPAQGPLPINVFQQGDTRRHYGGAGRGKADLEIQAKDNIIRISGKKEIAYPEEGERASPREDVQAPSIDARPCPCRSIRRHQGGVRDGVLALFIPRAESDKPRTSRSIEAEQIRLNEEDPCTRRASGAGKARARKEAGVDGPRPYFHADGRHLRDRASLTARAGNARRRQEQRRR